MKIITIITALFATVFANDCNICSEPLRIIVAVDTSSSVGPVNFRTAKFALTNLVESLKLNDNMGMGILRFSTKSEKVIDISSNTTDIKNAINSMKYIGGGVDKH